MTVVGGLDAVAAYEQMVLIRCFEETVLELYAAGGVPGTTHTYIGQEANAVGVIRQLNPAADNVISNHRNHGHYLAYSDDVNGLLREILAREGGVCEGRGGSQHLHSGRFLSNGVQGGIVPVAAGMAMAEKRAGTGAATVVFIGDGTLGEGVVYETLNMASLWSLPLLVVVENNRYAQTTPIERALAGSFTARAEAFAVASEQVDSTDVDVIYQAAGRALKHVREAGKPFWLVINTYRFAAHSKGDDFRPRSEIERYRAYDPLSIAKAKLDAKSCDAAMRKAKARIAAALAAAQHASGPSAPVEWLVRSGELWI
ncbi:MAG: thiamine pyrophosphate-dependent dehydrogenase E1 component subunit alpha [Pseudomonadota bacterium]